MLTQILYSLLTDFLTVLLTFLKAKDIACVLNV